ncbi:CAP domain-containing protein [Pedobacter psychrodurus]|uniref:CAP domain-containing protein n=1 Tax=Pedobacter psychrodurus TaxID=2530456 RepID=A0A4R0Q0D9_9SPHI|nr:CAP domain-containing protein [Pedobacter psychrodurus]TCD26620.1 CAP domain-containing protein [Pedobacter psychrodurus]
MKLITFPLACLALCCSLSCKKGPDDSPGTNDPPVLSTTTNINNEALLKLVNDTRLAGCNCGTTVMPPVGALTWSINLGAAAIGHSKYMASIKTLTHISANGDNVGARVKVTGYNWTSVGENTAVGQTTEAQVFNDWIKSEDHCKNIMNATFKEMGAAKTDNYWVQVFAAK